MGQCKCSVPSVEEEESAQQFRAMDANKNNVACRSEMSQYVASHAEMWAMLSVNLNLSEDVCKATATRVAMELASGLEGDAAMNAEITEAQFHTFRCRYMLDGKGAQEFFHRCVFASFDADSSHCLDAAKLDNFLDTFYGSGSIFEGDARLPPKEELKKRILSNSKSGGDKLTFEEIRNVLRGNTSTKPTTTTTTATTTSTPSTSTVEATSKHLSDNNNTDKNATSPESAPEQTPELAPPSLEISKREDEPEQTPEVQPFGTLDLSNKSNNNNNNSSNNAIVADETTTANDDSDNKPPSPTQQRKSRQRKSTKSDRAKSRSRSPSTRTSRKTSTANNRSKSPSARKKSIRSKSPSARARRSSRPTTTGSSEELLTNKSGHGGKSKSPSSRGRRRPSTDGGNDGGGKSRSPSSRKRRSSNRALNLNASGSGSQSEELLQPSGSRSKSPSSRKNSRKSIRASKSFDENQFNTSNHGGSTSRKTKRRHSTNDPDAAVDKRKSSKSPTPGSTHKRRSGEAAETLKQ